MVKSFQRREKNVAAGSKEVHLNKTKGLGGRHLEHNLMLSLCSENVDQIMHDGDMKI